MLVFSRRPFPQSRYCFNRYCFNKAFYVAIAMTCLLASRTEAAILLNSPTTEWYAIQYLGASRTDYLNDQQTGHNESDLVGSAVGVSPVQTAFYYRYDGASNQIGFRVRVDGDSQSAGFSGAIWAGFMFDSNDSVDLFAGVNATGQPASQGIGFFDPGTGANTSPNTTSIDNKNPLYYEVFSPSNFEWAAVTVGPGGNDPVSGGTDDIGGDGDVDYFATWILPFTELQDAALAQGFTVTPGSAFRFVLGTSNQANSLNQDLNGVDGGVNSSVTWSELGATSPLLTKSVGIVPEPSTYALILTALGGGLGYAARRRKRRAGSSPA